MNDRTGRARGTLSPVIYFCRSDGLKILPVYDAGCPEQAKKVFDERYKYHPTERWAFCETDGTLNSVRDLERDLVKQETNETSMMLDAHMYMRDRVRSKIAENLRMRMVSADTSPYERDFIAAWLKLRDEEKRDKYAQSLEQRNYYMYALHNDSTTKVEDKVISYSGEFWRTPEQQR